MTIISSMRVKPDSFLRMGILLMEKCFSLEAAMGTQTHTVAEPPNTGGPMMLAPRKSGTSSRARTLLPRACIR